MKNCWQFQSENRCTFNDIVQELQGNLEQGLHNLFVNPGYDVVPKLQTKEESQESYDYETPISTSTYIDVVR